MEKNVKDGEFLVKVKNVPQFAYVFKYLVAKPIANEFVFFGVWDDLEEAEFMARGVSGIVVETDKVVES